MKSNGIKIVGEDFKGEGVRALNNLCREQMICKLLADINMDLTVCELEGWDKREYINRLKMEIDHFADKLKDE